jgi:VCBS repeat-containing protein
LTTLASPDYTATRDATSLTVAPPPCQTVNAFIRPDDPPSIWPPNGELKTVDLLVNDPTGQITITVDSIFQDEPVGNQGADGIIVSSGTAIGTVQLRAARQGNGDGRVYHVTFTAADGQGFSCTHTVKIPVVPHDQGDNPNAIDGGALYDSTVTVKFGPDAEADSATTDENSPVSGNVLANDVPGKATDILTVTAVNGQAAAVGSQITLPSNAWLSLNGDGNFTYNPNGQFESLPVGSTALDTFTYQVSDDSGYTDVATVTLTISGVNDAPVAQNDSVSTGKTTPVSGNVLTNDSDIEGDALAVTAVNGQAAGVGQPVTLASGANLTLNSDGNFTYDPAGAFTNLPAGQQATDSFAYTIGDGRGGIATGQVTVTVTAANQAPLANDDTATLDEDQPGGLLIPVTANDTDVDGNLAPATVVIVTGPAKGTAVANPDGSVLYTPNPNFNGSDTFKYTVKDAAGLTSNLAKVTLTVNPVADPPLANDDQATVNVNLGPTGIIDVAANDIDVDGDLNLASVVVTGGPANGTATGQGNGTVAYTPTAGFIGQDSFVYQICDNTNACATATVSVTVSGNRPPDAVDDPNVTTKQGQAVIINVLANDTDPDGDALTVSQFSQGTRGTVTINADGTLTYTPSSNYKGSDTFTYTISDGRGGTDTATVTITISK